MNNNTSKKLTVKNRLTEYLPLIVVILMVLLMSLATNVAYSTSGYSSLMNKIMGFFLCLLAMFKLFNISGFADGFQMYDLIAKKCRKYAYCYPFIELSLGLAYLSNFEPIATNLITFIIMLISSIGVIKSLRSGMNIKCACLGTVLSVPLSTVSVVENLGMGLMAFYNLL